MAQRTDLQKTVIRWTLILVGGVLQLSIVVQASDDRKDKGRGSHESDEEYDEGCGGHCRYGCCEDNTCCDRPPGVIIPSFAAQILAVVGAFVATIILLFICFLRYRCIAKRRAEARRHRFRHAESGSVNPESPRQHGSSVYAINMPQQNLPGFFQALANHIELRANQHSANVAPSQQGRQLVQPPPYTERDTVISPPYDPYRSEGGEEEKPPAYSEVVKESVLNVNFTIGQDSDDDVQEQENEQGQTERGRSGTV